MTQFKMGRTSWWPVLKDRLKFSQEFFYIVLLFCDSVTDFLQVSHVIFYLTYYAKMLIYPCFSGLVFDLGGKNQICWNNTYCSEMDPRICFLLFEQFTSKKFSESNVWRFIISFDHHKVSGLQFVWGKTRKSNRLNWIRNP